MNPSTALLSFVLLALALSGTDGLKCYICKYRVTDGIADDGSEASCSQAPDAKFLVECTPETSVAILRPGQGQLDNNKTAPGDDQASPSSQTEWGCYTASGYGRMGGGGTVDLMKRGCVSVSKDQCQTKSFHEWMMETESDPLAQIIVDETDGNGMDHTIKFKGCYCKGEGCNQEEGSASQNTLSAALVAGFAVITIHLGL